MKTLSFAALGLLLGACRNGSAPSAIATAPSASTAASSTENASAPEITSDVEAQAPKLIFAIAHDEVKEGGIRSLTLAGRHRGTAVGVQVLVGPTGTSSRFKTVQMQRAEVTLRRAGDEGDRFLGALAEIYGIKGALPKMRPETAFTSISLAGDSDRLAAGPVKLRLVFKGAAESDIAELLLDIDWNRRVAHLDAKDESQREPLIRALTAR